MPQHKIKNIEKPPFDEVSFIMEYEGGDMEFRDVVNGFQHLIDSGMAWLLQRRYGRTAVSLIREGCCFDTHNIFGDVK